MKSQSDSLVSIASGLLKDVQMAYPSVKGVDLDLKRLTLLVSERGLGVFTLDLPARETDLISALETGRLPPNGYQKYSKGYPVPRLFAGLYMRIFERDLNLKTDADVNAIAFLRQLLVIGKKIEIPCSRKREQTAILEYVNVEHQMVGPSLRWDDDRLDCRELRNRIHLCDNLGPDLPLYPEYNIGRTAREQLLLARCQHFADVVARELGPFCPECHIEGRKEDGQGPGFRHGPGAVAEQRGRFYDKNSFTNWSDKLHNYYPWETTGKMPNDQRVRPRNHEVPARLICVPKTAKGPRIIAAEPSEHMYTQNLFASWIVQRIKETKIGRFIDFSDQSLSGELVIKASLDRSLSTIDLSSASDRLSLHVVERIFRSNPSFLTAMHATRTRWLRLPNGESIKLKKFASQGTALTFPVQTLVFWVIAMASSHEGFLEFKDLDRYVNRVRIFGDDIIVPNDRYVETTTLLTALQLKVNKDKSFVNGYFRESCGVDAWKGFDITPTKPRTVVSDSPAACKAVIDTLNNLFYKGYWNASEQLKNRRHFIDLKGLQVVGRAAGATGIGCFSASGLFDSWFNGGSISGPNVSHFQGTPYMDQRDRFRYFVHKRARLGRHARVFHTRLRWNQNLQRSEARITDFTSVCREQPFDCGYSGLLLRQLRPPALQYWFEAGAEIKGVPVRPVDRKVNRWVALSDLF